MIKEIITKIAKQNPSLGEFIDGLDFIKQVHSFYKIIGGIKNPSCSKGIFKYVANEHEIGWMYVVKFLNLLMTNVDQKRFEAYKENIDWECVCQQYCPKEMKEANTKVAFKDLFYLVALNKNDDIESILAEHYLSAYGWLQIVKKVIVLYENMLSTDNRYIEQIYQEEAPLDKEEDCEVIEVPVEESAAVIEVPVESVPVIENEPAPPIKNKKYSRGRTIILLFPDGTRSEWKSTQAIHEALGISKVAVRKNISGNSRYIRFNHQKYQAFYKEAC